MKIALLALALLQVSGSVRLQPDPVVDNDEFMRILMKPSYAELQESVARAPSDRQAWAAIYEHAAKLAEIENLLFIRHRVDANDARWARAAADARQASADLTAAALAGLRDANAADYQTVRSKYEAVSASCNACHRTFSREAPVIKP